MGLEGQHKRGNATFPRQIQRTVQNRLMAAMNPVEIADGDDATFQALGQRILLLVAMENSHVRVPVQASLCIQYLGAAFSRFR